MHLHFLRCHKMCPASALPSLIHSMKLFALTRNKAQYVVGQSTHSATTTRTQSPTKNDIYLNHSQVVRTKNATYHSAQAAVHIIMIKVAIVLS